MNIIRKKLQAVLDIVDYPELLQTVGHDVDRGFVKELLFVRKMLGISFKTILDVGAAEGEYTKAARFVFPQATIHVFEPIQESLDKIRPLSVMDKKIHLHQYALGSEDRLAVFHKNAFSFSSSLLPMLERHKELFPHTHNEQAITVSCRRLDSFDDLAIASPALLKIDVQGSELDVIRGGERLIGSVDAVQLEVCFEPFYQGQAPYDEIMSYMRRLGFTSFAQLDPHYSQTKPLKIYYCDLMFFR